MGILKSPDFATLNMFNTDNIAKGSALFSVLNKYKIFDGIWYNPLFEIIDDKKISNIYSTIFDPHIPAHYIFKYCKHISQTNYNKERVIKDLLPCLDSIVSTNFNDFYQHQAIILSELNGSSSEEFKKFLIQRIEKGRLGINLIELSPSKKVLL